MQSHFNIFLYFCWRGLTLREVSHSWSGSFKQTWPVHWISELYFSVLKTPSWKLSYYRRWPIFSVYLFHFNFVPSNSPEKRLICRPWRACNWRTVAPQSLLQRGGRVTMMVGGPNTPPEFPLPPLLCLPPAPPRLPPPESQSPEWKDPGSDRTRWTCGVQDWSGLYRPREPAETKVTAG